jgi:hypothetical protein
MGYSFSIDMGGVIFTMQGVSDLFKKGRQVFIMRKVPLALIFVIKSNFFVVIV